MHSCPHVGFVMRGHHVSLAEMMSAAKRDFGSFVPAVVIVLHEDQAVLQEAQRLFVPVFVVPLASGDAGTKILTHLQQAGATECYVESNLPVPTHEFMTSDPPEFFQPSRN